MEPDAEFSKLFGEVKKKAKVNQNGIKKKKSRLNETVIPQERKNRDAVPKWRMTNNLSNAIFPTIPHYWLSDGRLLVLTDPNNPDNAELFKVS